MTENITLPREVAEYLMETMEELSQSKDWYWSERDKVALPALRKALAAEPTKPEPVRCNPADYCAARHMNLYTAPPATHPGYVIGSHWLETAYSRICAGEAEADVLRDCGWERVDEALRRDAEKWRKAQAKYIAWQKGGKAEAMEGT